MSKLKIKGNASGTGTVTVEAPNTNTDRTITLPDSAGTLLMTDGDGSNLTGLSHTPEGTAVVSTGETGATKFLREDGDGTCSWQAAGGGAIASVTTVQTRTQGTYSAPTSGDGTEITPLTLTVTPAKAGNKMILEWIVNGEMYQDDVYIVTRNGTKLTDTTNASNDRWAGVTAQPSGLNNDTTPDNAVVTIIDNSTLSTSSIYRILVRSSYSGAGTLYFNRAISGAGSDRYEASLSTGIATEITV